MDRDVKGQFIKGHSSFCEKQKKRKIKNCLICNKEIIVRPCEEKVGKKFCSHKHYAEWLKGKVGYWKNKKRPEVSNEKNVMWKGDNVGYDALHDWVNRKLGKPDKCEHCGKSGLKGKYIQWANKSGLYLRDLSDWLRLCVPCHMRQDGRSKLS